MKTLKLYKVKLVNHEEYFVVADNLSRGYEVVRKYLDSADIYFPRYRELLEIKLMAEDISCPNCGKMLIIDKEQTND